MLKNLIHRFSFVYQNPSKNLLINKKFTIEDKQFVNNFQAFHISCSINAKGKDIKKEKRKNTQIDEIELGELFNVQKLFDDFRQPLEHFKTDLAEGTALRSSQAAIENVKIQFEGENYTIQDLASIKKKSPKLYVLDFSSFPQTISTVMNTLLTSELNLNAQQEGTRIFVPIPKLTKEHRETLAKKAKLYFNNYKNNIRDMQNKYIKKLRNMEKLSDEKRNRITDQIIALGKKSMVEAEEVFKTKQIELLKTEE